MLRKKLSVIFIFLMLVNLCGTMAFHATATETELDKTIWTATAKRSLNTNLPNMAVDGNANTHSGATLISWEQSTQTQEPGDWFKVDMGKVNKVSKIIISGVGTAGEHSPRNFKVILSTDSATTYTSSSLTGAVVKDTTVDLGAEYDARYIKIELTNATSIAARWIISELYAYGSEYQPTTIKRILKTGWVATSSGYIGALSPDKAIDSWLSSHNSSGAALFQCAPNSSQQVGKWFKINMGKKNKISRLLMSSMVAVLSGPARFKVEVSNDDAVYTQVATGKGDSVDKLNYNTVVTFDEVTAQYVRITLIGEEPVAAAGTTIPGHTWSWYMSDAQLYGENLTTLTPFDKTIWTATASSYTWLVPNIAVDGDYRTHQDYPTSTTISNFWERYSGGNQTANDFFQVDMGKQNSVNNFALNTVNSLHPQNYTVSTSNDNVNYTSVTNQTSKIEGNNLTITFNDVTARYIKITINQTGTQRWLITEVDAYGLESNPVSLEKINKSTWTATASGSQINTPTAAIDGKVNTHTTNNNEGGALLWQCTPNGAQTAGSYFQINMGKINSVSRLHLSDLPVANAFPVNFDVQYSTNGITFIPVSSIVKSRNAYNTIVTFSEVEAKYIKIVITADATTHSWYMSEAYLFGKNLSAVPSDDGYSVGALQNTISWGSKSLPATSTIKNLHDAKYSTTWSLGSNQAVGNYIKVALDKAYPISAIGVLTDTLDTHANKFRVLVSLIPEDTLETDVVATIGTADQTKLYNYIPFESTKKAQYLYIVIDEAAAKQWRMTEIFIYPTFEVKDAEFYSVEGATENRIFSVKPGKVKAKRTFNNYTTDLLNVTCTLALYNKSTNKLVNIAKTVGAIPASATATIDVEIDVPYDEYIDIYSIKSFVFDNLDDITPIANNPQGNTITNMYSDYVDKDIFITNPTITNIESGSQYETFKSAMPDVDTIFYEGADYKGASTSVFAYMGVPANATAQSKVPAIVFVHGGGGTAYDSFVKEWVDKGYAAISMDLTGQFPDKSKVPNGGPGHKGYSADMNETLKDRWMSQCLSNVILANNILRNDPRIDSSKIGVTGISWGGVITSSVIGIDQRFAFAIPVYGSGFLYQAETYFAKEIAGNENIFEPSRFIAQSQIPILWLNSNADGHFPLSITSKSFNVNTTNSKTRMSVHPYSVIGHDHATGWGRKEVFDFAQNVVSNGTDFIKINSTTTAGVVNYTIPTGVTVKEIQLYTNTSDKLLYTNFTSYSTFTGAWTVTNVGLTSNDNGTATIAIPSGTKIFYVNIIDNNDRVVSTEMITIN